MSDSLRPHGLQHARPPCPSPTPGACSNSRSSSQWAIQPSYPLSSPSPPAFNLSQHQGLFQWVSSPHQVVKVLELQLQHQSFQLIFRADFQLFFIVQLLHLYMTTGKTIAWTRWTFVGKVMSLLFNMLSRLVFPRSKVSSKEQVSFKFMVAVTICSDFGAPQNKVSLFVSPYIF